MGDNIIAIIITEDGSFELEGDTEDEIYDELFERR